MEKAPKQIDSPTERFSAKAEQNAMTTMDKDYPRTFQGILLCPYCKGEVLTTDCNCKRTGFKNENFVSSFPESDSRLLSEEVKVQDSLSSQYETLRYKINYSRFYYENIFRRICSIFRNCPLILDNGCGNGAFYDIVPEFPPRTTSIIGLDISPGMLSFASKRLKNLVHGDSCALPFKDCSMDGVISKGLLHHLPSPPKGVSEVHRVLKPGSRAVFFEPHCNLITRLPRYFANKTAHFSEDHKSFTDSELKLLFNDFEVESFEYIGFIAYPLLAFPDLMDFSKVLPLEYLKNFLLKLDNLISKIPIINRLSWALLVTVRKI